MRIALGADHAGVAVKGLIKLALRKRHLNFEDMGTDSEVAVDYPDFARSVAESVASGKYDRGILVCGSGVGMAIAANKVIGIRAATILDVEGARLSREHNDANVLALPGRNLQPDIAIAIVDIFLKTKFAGGRHKRRVDKIISMEHQKVRSQ